MSSISDLHAAFDADQFRSLGHKLVDRLAGYLHAATGGSRMPVLPGGTPDQLAAVWPPRFQSGPSAKLDELVARLLAGSNHLHHPRYVGHQVAPVLPSAALAQFAAALLNNSLGVFEMGPSGAAVERSLVHWMTQSLGWGPDADGVLTSGGALGTLTALLAMRQAAGLPDPADEPAPARFAVLASEHAHYSVERAVRIMGWGRHGLVPVPVDERFRMRRTALEDSWRTATRAGLRVIGVVANACSTATGTYDPLEEIADACATRGLWLHVDGAHGAPAVLSPQYRSLMAGVERADSVVWDGHKMMLMPLLATGVLFRQRSQGERAFASTRAPYLYDEQADAREEISRRTLECSKPAMGFPLYAALSLYGTGLFSTYVTAMFDLARRFAGMIEQSRDFELATPPDANIVCFRYVGGAGELDAVQATVRRKIVAQGSFYLVQTRLPAGLFLRTTLINPFTSDTDLADLLAAVRAAAR